MIRENFPSWPSFSTYYHVSASLQAWNWGIVFAFCVKASAANLPLFYEAWGSLTKIRRHWLICTETLASLFFMFHTSAGAFT